MSNDMLHIIIERAASQEHTTFHVNRSLCSTTKSISFFHDNGETHPCTSYDRETRVEPMALMLADEICRITGVRYGNEYIGAVDITQHTINVAYGRAYDENDIEFEVIMTIAGVLGTDLDQVTFELDNSAREPQFADNTSRISWTA